MSFNRNPVVLVVVLACLAALIGCAGSPVATHQYLLRPEVTEARPDLAPSTRYAFGGVQVAPYIDRPGLVLEVASGEIQTARHHRWAEPLPEAIEHYLLRQMSTALGAEILPARVSAAPTIVEVRIDQLHGTRDGHAKLVASWHVRGPDELLETNEVVETLPLATDGYGALVAAEEQLLDFLATRIARSLDTRTPKEDVQRSAPADS